MKMVGTLGNSHSNVARREHPRYLCLLKSKADCVCVAGIKSLTNGPEKYNQKTARYIRGGSGDTEQKAETEGKLYQ